MGMPAALPVCTSDSDDSSRAEMSVGTDLSRI